MGQPDAMTDEKRKLADDMLEAAANNPDTRTFTNREVGEVIAAIRATPGIRAR